MLRIYHNPQCKKSRAGLQHLQSKGIPVEIIEYIKTPLTEIQLGKLIMKLNRAEFEHNMEQVKKFWFKILKKSIKGKHTEAVK